MTVRPAAAQQNIDNRAADADDAQPGLLLDTITVEGEGARGPDSGIVARRSVAGTKTDTLLLETPQAISIVTSDQWQAQGANSIPQALRYTPGVMPEPNGHDIRYDWLYIRGFNSHGIQFLDGLTLAGDSNNYATPSINPYTLERIEVIKGPSSVLYGRTVPGGLINLVGKRPQATPHHEVILHSGGFGGIQGSVDITGPLTSDKAWTYRFVGQARNLGSQVDHERDKQVTLAPSLTWRPSDKTQITAYGYYQHDRPIFSPRFYPAAGTLLFNQAGNIPRNVFLGEPGSDTFERDYFHVGYEFEHVFNETWTVRQNLRYGYSDQKMHMALVNPAFAFSGVASNVLNRVAAVSDDWLSNFAVDTQAEATFSTGKLNHTLLAGVDYLHAVSSTKFGNSASGDSLPSALDFLNPIYGYPVSVPAYQRSGLQKQDQVGFYAQDQIRYDRWVATFGLRYDISQIDAANRLVAGRPEVTTKDEKLTGRAGITYLFDNGLAPYASYSTSFLPILGTDKSGNPFEALKAEQFEVGVKYEPKGARGLITLSLFQMKVEDSLTPDPSDPRPWQPTYQVQGGKERVRGVEIEGKYEVSPELDVLASYAYSHSKVLRTNNPAAQGREMLRLPEHQAAVWLNYSPAFLPGFSINSGVRYTSAYRTDATYNDDLRIPERTLVDIGAQYDFGKLDKTFEGTTLQVNVSNLFDDRYVSHCLNTTGGSCNYGAGRAITASLRYTW